MPVGKGMPDLNAALAAAKKTEREAIRAFEDADKTEIAPLFPLVNAVRSAQEAVERAEEAIRNADSARTADARQPDDLWLRPRGRA